MSLVMQLSPHHCAGGNEWRLYSRCGRLVPDPKERKCYKIISNLGDLMTAVE